ncbi:MAG: ATPase [Clostridia bacterium]|nr:ATPase [Clostridia bacterium]
MSSRKVSVESLIDEMYDALERATKLPLMSKSLVNISELTSILDEINENLPGEISQARSIVNDRNNIIEDAKREAEGIIKNARARAEVLVSQEEVLRTANAEAAALVEETQAKIREMKKAANDYVDDIMLRTDDAIAASLSEIRQTRQNIKSTQRS